MLPSIPTLASADGGVTKHGAAAATLFDAIMADTPLGYWRTVAGTDSSGNSRPLTAFGTPTAGTSLDASSANASMVFNGSNNMWNPEKYAAFDLTAAVSVSFLMKATTVDSADLVRKATLYGAYLGGDGKAHARVTVGGVAKIADGATTIAPGTTYHVGMSYDGSTVSLYLNGALNASVAASGAIDVDNAQSFTVGLNTAPYTGTVDEVALYDHALSAGRFAAHAAAAGV